MNHAHAQPDPGCRTTPASPPSSPPPSNAPSGPPCSPSRNRNHNLAPLALPEPQETSSLPCDVGSDRGRAGARVRGPADAGLRSRGRAVPRRAGAVGARGRRGGRAVPRRAGPAAGSDGGRGRGCRPWRAAARLDGELGRFRPVRWSYTFDPDGGEQASLVETEESLQRRGGVRLTKEDQLELKKRAEKELDALGYQLLSKDLS
uniref:Putative phosphoglycerate mutase family protein n=1 Tax=Neofusicoccum australe TaxID=240362 RepID=A0A343K000_9PEZI|nr:putative phosphoglycerate mutase family protein [Neofusicoccum australe]